MANRDNPRRGAQFEEFTQLFFSRRRIKLERGFVVDVGVADQKRPHKFDLGSHEPPVLVECKRHTWTKGGNAPSAKLAVWNEAMYYFATAPQHYRRILAVLRSLRGEESLAEHYIKRFEHLIPEKVEIWEIDPKAATGARVHP